MTAATVPAMPADPARPTVDDWNAYNGRERFQRIGTYTRVCDPSTGIVRGYAAASGRPARASMLVPGLTDRPTVDTMPTRNRKRTSFVARAGMPWNVTTGDDAMIDPALGERVLRIVTGSDDETAAGLTAERRLVLGANALIAGTAGMRTVSPITGRSFGWDDERQLGGYRLLDRPFERFAARRVMLPTFIGPHRGDRAMIDETTIDPADWCDRHARRVGVCGCVRPRPNSLGQCARHVYELAGLADAFGHPVDHDGTTTVADANGSRSTVGAPSRHAVYDVCETLAEIPTGRIDRKGRPIVRKIRGVRHAARLVLYASGRDLPRDPISGRADVVRDGTATVHVDGTVTHVLGWVERVTVRPAGMRTVIRPLRPHDPDWRDAAGRKSRRVSVYVPERRTVRRVPMLGHVPADVADTVRPSTTAGRDHARDAIRSLADRRHDVAAELTGMLATMPVGGSAVYDPPDGAAVTCGRTRRDRYVIGQWSAGSAAAVAVRAARAMVPA